MKFLSAIALLAVLTGPAAAQMMNLMPEVKTRTPEEKEQDAITDKAYRESLRKIPDTKTASDPWGGVRSDTPKAAPAKPRTRTGSATN
jgi:hypothetical protein